MSLGQKIIDFIEKRRQEKLFKIVGPLGDFYRAGGNELLSDIPVESTDIVLDIGAYKGEWTSSIFIRYGCQCHLYEPVKSFYDICFQKFKVNPFIKVFNAAIGNSMRQGVFHLSDNGTSEFIKEKQEKVIAPVIDIKSVLDDLSDSKIGCLKINIEGGEYELMERLNEVNYNSRIKCFLIQFHQQPSDYLKRYENIVRDLSKTHSRVWSYDMVWEKWIIK